MSATPQSVPQKVHQLADKLAADATWEDVIYQAALQRSIEQGLAQANAGLLIPAEQLLAELNNEINQRA